MALIKDADRFQKVASGINSYLVAFGLIIGAVWTYHTFNAELHVQNATAQLEKLNRDLAKEPRLEIDLEIQPLTTGSSKTRILIGRLLVKNVGTGPAVLSLGDTDNPPFRLYEVGWSKGHEDWKHAVSFFVLLDKGEKLGEMIVPSGSTNQARFAVSVSRPGLYVLVLKTPRTGNETVHAKVMGATLSKVYWRGANYFWVK